MILKKGQTGMAVAQLQKKLAANGFSPGTIDGDFGPATEAALLNFQKSQGLLADGMAVPRTLEKLQLELGVPAEEPVEIDAALVAKMIPFTPRANINKFLPSILKEMKELDIYDRPMILMALSTVAAETPEFAPISEYVSKYNSSPGRTDFNLYDYRQDLGNQGPPDGRKYRGRGFIQLTGRYNYRHYGKVIGRDLENDPDQANYPDVAAELLGRFLKDREIKIKSALLAGDLRTARRLVNGGSHGLDVFSRPTEEEKSCSVSYFSSNWLLKNWSTIPGL